MTLLNNVNQEFILSLTRSQLVLIGQLLHIHLAQPQDHPIGESLLQTLIAETDCVATDPSRSFVFSQKTPPPSAQRPEPVWHLPVD